MKIKKALIILVLIIILAFAVKCVLGTHGGHNNYQRSHDKHIKEVIDYVIANNEQLCVAVAEIQNSTLNDSDEYPVIEIADVPLRVNSSDNGNVEFVFSGEGFASVSTEYGFFYSADDSINGFYHKNHIAIFKW